jgi:hypothetical protein
MPDQEMGGKNSICPPLFEVGLRLLWFSERAPVQPPWKGTKEVVFNEHGEATRGLAGRTVQGVISYIQKSGVKSLKPRRKCNAGQEYPAYRFWIRCLRP